MMKSKISTESAKAGINKYLLLPDVLTNARNKRIREAFNARSLELQNEEAAKILKEIRHMDRDLADDLGEYSEEACQISLIRDALLQVWKTGELDTKPISVIGAQPASRFVSSVATA